MVHLSRYDVYAMGRYEQVHAALTDWQDFRSAAGVGMPNFRHEKPWRPPSLLLEADPPHHDAPRRVLSEILGPRALRGLRQRWLDDAEVLVDELLPADGHVDLDAVTELAQAFPLRVFPDAVGLGRSRAGRTCCPTGTTRSTPSGPANDLVPSGAAAGAGAARPGWPRSARARSPRRRRVRRRDLGRRRPRRHHAGSRPRWSSGRCCRPASTPRCTAWAPCCTRSPPTREQWQRLRARPGAGPRRLRRGRPLGVAGADLLPHRHPRCDDRRHRGPGRPQDPDVPRLGQPRPAPLGATRRVRPRPRPVRPRRVRHGHPPVRRAARRPAGGRGRPHRAGRTGRDASS